MDVLERPIEPGEDAVRDFDRVGEVGRHDDVFVAGRPVEEVIAELHRLRHLTGEPEGFSESIELKQTYRFGQPIADSTHHFVTRGSAVIDREVVGFPDRKPEPSWPSSIVIASSRLTPEGVRRVGGHPRGLTGGALATLARIEAQSDEAEVLIVGRKNADLEEPGEEAEAELAL